MSPAIGSDTPRVEGRMKVTGLARYAADFPVEDLAYAVMVDSTIANGRVSRIDTRDAESADGVLAVFTHLNAPALGYERQQVDPPVGERVPMLQSDRVHHHGQPVAVVVADTLERAEDAASLVNVEYEEEEPLLSLQNAGEVGDAFVPEGQFDPAETTRGDRGALDRAAIRIDGEYAIRAQHHHPIEPHATLAAWEGDMLTLYDKTQGIDSTRRHMMGAFDLTEDQVHVISPYVGGAFGGAGRSWSHVFLAAMAAREVERPVKLVLTREQMFTGAGHRPRSVQRVSLAADEAGSLQAIEHEALQETAAYEEYGDNMLSTTRFFYECANVYTRLRLARLNVPPPTFMRGPGYSSGNFAMESAMDELAVELGMDPVELRLANYAERDQSQDLPYSSKYLRECYERAAERFGWANRNPEPRSMRGEDGQLIGWGMASTSYPAERVPCGALARIDADGTAYVASSATDMGPGTQTAMVLTAADSLGLPPDRVRPELGDSRLPLAPMQAVAWLNASLGMAVRAACEAVREDLIGRALGQEESPLFGTDAEDLEVEDGRVFVRSEPSRGESYGDIFARLDVDEIEAVEVSEPGSELGEYSRHSFGAQFVEVRVDEDLGTIRVPRVVSAFDIGRVVSLKTARSQVIGGIVGGIGGTLMEEAILDHNLGRYANANLADYHVPVNADIEEIEPIFIDEPDYNFTAIGAKGLGEITIVGVSAAIANAVYHATGRRVRDLPITLDKVL